MHSILCVHKNRSHSGHFTIRNEIKADQTKRFRDCRRHRKEGLYLKLVSENWDSALNLNDVEEAVNNLEAKIKHHMDECMPLWSVHMSSRDRV